MKKKILPLLALILASSFSFYASAQTVGDYRSNAATFNWNVDASWQRWDGAAWADPTVGGFGYPGENATGLAGTVTIQNGHTVTANTNITTNDLGNLILQGNGTINVNGGNTIDIAGDLSLLGSSVINMTNNNIDIDVAGNLTMDGTSQILGNHASRDLQVTGTLTIPGTATNARVSGVTLTIIGATTVTGTFVLNSNTGTKTFNGRVLVTGSWTSTAINTTNRLVFGGEVITSGIFDCGCN